MLADGDSVARNAFRVGLREDTPLPVSVELTPNTTAEPELAEAIRERLRNVLVVQTRVDLVRWGSLQRSEYKSELVEHY